MRYMGGKFHIARQLVHWMQPIITNSVGYIEPFLGSGSVMTSVNHINRIGSGAHKALMTLYISIQQGWQLPKQNATKEEYLRLKAEQDTNNPLTGFVGFTQCFGGKYFAANTIGDKRNYALNAHRSIKRLKLNTFKLLCCDYSYYTSHEFKDYAFYCDPPYEGTMPYKGTEPFDYIRFYQWARVMSQRNKLFISGYTAPADFVAVLEIPVPIHMGHYKRTAVEKLFVYAPYREQWELERLLALYQRGLTSSPE